MPELKQGYWVDVRPVVLHDGSAALCFVAKRTFRVPEAELVVEPLEEDAQPVLLEADVYDDGDPPAAPPTLESDYAPEKAGADVIVLGKAYAPEGKAATEWEARLRIGRLIRRLRLIGPRTARWQPPKKRQGEMVPSPPVFDPPKPVKEVVLSLGNAYGGTTRVVPDPSELEMIRTVQKVLDEEQAAEKAAHAAAKEEKAKQAEKAKEEAARDAILNAPMGGLEDEKGLRRARGEFGYDDEGVRVWGEATSKRGTAVMDLDTFAKWQASQAEAEAAAAEATAEKARRAALRANIDGDKLEADDGVELLDAGKLAKERERARADLAAWRAEWEQSARKRRREQVQSNDGTRMLDLEAMGLGEEDAAELDADAAWEARLRGELEVADAERRAALRAEIEAFHKARAEKLAEFPELPCPTNPFGKGFVVSNVRELLDGLPLPLIEDPDAPLTPNDLVRDPLRLDAVPLPAGFSTWPKACRPRIDKAGAYPDELASFEDVNAAQQRALDLSEPDDVAAAREYDRREKPKPIEPGFWNSAAPWLQLPQLVGDEEIELDHLSKTGHLIFRLPGRAVLAEIDRGAGVERRELNLDTLVIAPDDREVTMVWRTHYPLATLDEVATYPQLAAWVLDLDVKDKRAADWAEAAAKKRGDGTAILDVSDLEKGEDYWRTISDERLAAEAAEASEGTAALDIRRMGLYREADDSAWENEASEGVVDESALAKKKAEEEAWLEEKQKAVAALEDKEKQDAVRREEVAEAAKAGKPIPPPDHEKSPKELAAAKKARAAKVDADAKASAKASAKGGKAQAPADPPPPPDGPAERPRPAPKGRAKPKKKS